MKLVNRYIKFYGMLNFEHPDNNEYTDAIGSVYLRLQRRVRGGMNFGRAMFRRIEDEDD